MDKLKYIKLEQPDGSYSESIPLSVTADNIDIELESGNQNLEEYINNNNIEINNLKTKSNNFEDSINENTIAINTQKTRIDNLAVLEEGSTTGDAELIDMRTDFEGDSYVNAGGAVRGAEEKLNNKINENFNNITPDRLMMVTDGNTLGEVSNKSARRYFGPTTTSGSYIFDDLYETLPNRMPCTAGDSINVIIKASVENVGNLFSLWRPSIQYFREGETSVIETVYGSASTLESNTITYTFKVPNEDYTHFRIAVQEVLRNAPGTGNVFWDILDIDYLYIWTGIFNLNEKLFPNIALKDDVEEVNEDLVELKEQVDNLESGDSYDSITKRKFHLLQGARDGNGFNLSKYNLHTWFLPFDFEEAILEVPDGYIIGANRWASDFTYLRYGGDPVQKFTLKKNNDDEAYFTLVVKKANGDQILVGNFDPSNIKISYKPKNILNTVYNRLNTNINGMYFQDRITNAKATYWIYNTDGNGKHRYTDESIEKINLASGVPTIFITDTHWRTNSPSKFSWDLCGLIASRIDCNNIVFGGDALTQHATVNEGWMQLENEITPFTNRFGKNFKYCFGNHDANVANVGTASFPTPADQYRIPYQNIYSTCISHLKDVVNFEETDLHINTEEWYRHKLHYYYDDFDNEIRYIIMDSGTRYDALEYGGTPTRLKYQYDWLAKVLKDTPKGYHIMVFAHQFWTSETVDDVRVIADTDQGRNVCQILAAYENGLSIEGTDGNIEFSYDFTEDNRCPIIAMVSGHVHFDSLDVKYGIQQIVTTTDAIDKTSHWNVEMTAGTTTEHAFDVIKIDKDRRKVNIFRIGAGEDRNFTY